MRRPQRGAVPCVSVLAGVLPWFRLHEPGHLEGLVASAVLALLIVPVVLVLVVFGVPYLTAGLIPREWRAKYRGKYTRESQKSAYIPAWLRRATLAADRHRCVHCGRTDDLQIDHVIPWRLGGLTALLNMMTLCGPCNRFKSNYYRRRNGTVCYNPFKGFDRPAVAAAILDSERRHRLNPLRWVFAAHGLGWI
jgi:hypothetical protein